MTETETPPVDPLARFVDDAKRRRELLTEEALAAVVEAPTQADIDAIQKEASRKRKIEREQERKDAQAEARRADAVRKLEASILADDHRDLRAARKAEAKQRRWTDPRARLATTYRRSAATSFGLAGVVIGGVCISASTVQANVAGDANPGDMRWWSGFFFEALVSVLLIAIMVTRTTASEWGVDETTDPEVKKENKKEALVIVAVEAALLGTSVWLNVFPYLMPAGGEDIRWSDVLVHSLPPLAMTAAVIAHPWSAKKYARSLERAHAAMAAHKAEAAAAAVAATGTAGTVESTAGTVETVGPTAGTVETVGSTVGTVGHAVASTVDTGHGERASEHRADSSTVESMGSTVETVASTVDAAAVASAETVAAGEGPQNSTVAEPWSTETGTVDTETGHGERAVTVDTDHGHLTEEMERELRELQQARRGHPLAYAGEGEPVARSERADDRPPVDEWIAAELGTERISDATEAVGDHAAAASDSGVEQVSVTVDCGGDFGDAVTVGGDRGAVDGDRSAGGDEPGADPDPAGPGGGDRGTEEVVTVVEPSSTVATVAADTVDHGSGAVTVAPHGHRGAHAVGSVTVNRGPVPATVQHTDSDYDYYLVLAREVRTRLRRSKYGVEAIADALIKHYRHGMGLDAIYAAGGHDGSTKGPHRDATANWFRIAQEVMDERTGSMAPVVPLRKEG